MRLSPTTGLFPTFQGQLKALVPPTVLRGPTRCARCGICSREASDRLIDCNLILSVAFPAEAVLCTIKRMKPDLLVMGTSGFGRLGRALLGSTASLVLDAASCDVLVIPQGSTRHIAGRAPAASQIGGPR